MTMFERFETARIQQQMLTRQLQTRHMQREMAQPILAERAAERWFRLTYTVRHWVHRMAPRMARAFL
ncbi:MAG TPA: hypothetical protein VNT75_31840 [Symbiobacteriaceae bacterium]|nr:hypothetical protein [Symbiobacteriaceae bacterium]